MGKIIAVTASKGGVGKTTMIVNMAVILAQQGKHVLIVDIDGQGNTADAFNLAEPEKTMYDVLMGEADIKDVITPIEKDEPYNRLFIAPAGEAMNKFEYEVWTHISEYGNPFFLLSLALKPIKNDFDYIFIDTPPSLGLTVGNAMLASDGLIIPFIPDKYAIKGMGRVIDLSSQLSKDAEKELKVIAIIPVMVESRTNVHSGLLTHAKKFCEDNGLHMTETHIPRTIRYTDTVAYEGKPPTMTGEKQPTEIFTSLIKEVFIDG